MSRQVVPQNVRTCIKPSPGKGRGVFALEAIAEGEIIEIAPTITIPRCDVSMLKSTMLVNYFFTDEEDETRELLAFGHASMYNHASEPNADWATGNDQIIIRATAAIEQGEEITIDYGWSDEDYELLGIKQ